MSRAVEKPSVSILGCGWYGLPLGAHLVKNGYVVKGSTTSHDKLPILKEMGIEASLLYFEGDEIKFENHFFDCEILIITIPPKKDSAAYVNKIRSIIKVAKAVKQIIFISSTGVYADTNNRVDERVIPNPITESGTGMYIAEKLLREKYQFNTTIIRFAGLIGPQRYLAKHFAGKKDIPNGLAPINLIHLKDCIGITEAIINQKAFGKIYHAVSPHHPSRSDFYTKNCQVQDLEPPVFKPELLSWKIIESTNVPELNYEFEVKDWDKWLANLKSELATQL